MIKYEDLIAFPPGQVAQLVERSPEKAGVGGSIPSLATISNNLQTCFSEFGCTSTTLLHCDYLFCRLFYER